MLSVAPIVLPASAFVAMLVHSEQLCRTPPVVQQPKRGRIYAMACHEDRWTVWLTEEERNRNRRLFVVGTVGFGVLGYCLLTQFPKSSS